MFAQQIEAAPQAGQHTECEDIHLQQLQRIDIVLVPLEDGASLHRRVADDRHFCERPTAHDEPADMGCEMSRKILDLGR